jgi:hypothetical protein
VLENNWLELVWLKGFTKQAQMGQNYSFCPESGKTT